jgi:hypothetical protein
MDRVETGWGDVGWTGLVLDWDKCGALVNAVMNLRVPYCAGTLSSGSTAGGLDSAPERGVY